MEIDIQHDKEKRQFYATINGKIAKLDYSVSPDGNVLEYYSTFVPPELRGQHIGEKIVLYALKYAKDNDLKIIPSCPFVKRVLENNSEYQELIFDNL